MPFAFSEERQKLLEHDGHALVIGGPGSGKTTLALQKAQKHINAGLPNGKLVLFLSFSRAAVARVVEGASEWLPSEQLKRISVQTFHSFFWSIVKTHGYLLGSPKKISLLLPHDEKVLNQGIESGSDDWAAWEAERECLFLEDGRLTFDLFSAKAKLLIEGSEVIKRLLASKYPLIIIDEAQDTDDMQWQCAQSLAAYSQLICLADEEQQIYDFREGVSADRVDEIRDSLAALYVDLGSENNRSPDTEILQFGNALLNATPRPSAYQGISRLLFPPQKESRDNFIRRAVGMLNSKIVEATGERPHSLALLATSNRGVKTIVNALQGNGEQSRIQHKVHFDETLALLGSRTIAFLIEPIRDETLVQSKIEFLSLLIQIEHARGNKTALKKARSLQKYVEDLQSKGSCRPVKLILEIDTLLHTLKTSGFTGDPRIDWLSVRKLLRNSNSDQLQSLDTSVEYLMAFNRGKVISDGLSSQWQKNGDYSDAREILSTALTQDQLMGGDNDTSGIHVMTMHKSKGKQFDGVIALHADRICSFDRRGDVEANSVSRKLLRVGVTRAKHHTLLLVDAYNQPALLNGFVFP